MRSNWEPSAQGFHPITGNAGHQERKKDPLTELIQQINTRYGTNFTQMDKVLLQIESDYAAKEEWQGYAQHNDFKTFMLLFNKEFPNLAVERYNQNDAFFVKMFSEPDMMKQVTGTIGGILYEQLRMAHKYPTPDSSHQYVAEKKVDWDE